MTKSTRKSAAAIALITVGTLLATSASATPLLRTVHCNDGSIFKVGDHLTDEQVCQAHGGVERMRDRRTGSTFHPGTAWAEDRSPNDPGR